MNAARILIAGAGPVGLVLACACRDFDVTVIEAAPPRVAPLPEPFDVRVFALSAGTRTFLRDIGAWEHLDARRVAPVRRMEIFGDAGAKLSFSGRAGSPLAWIVEANRLAHALEEQAKNSPRLLLLRASNAVAFEAAAEGARVTLDNGETLAGDLLVGADGPDSRVRTLLGLASDDHPYAEAALVANFETEREHGAIARQWFRPDGVLAWLPLAGRRISIVWSALIAASRRAIRGSRACCSAR